MSKPPQSEGSEEFGAIAMGLPASAAQHVAASLVICVSRIAAVDTEKNL